MSDRLEAAALAAAPLVDRICARCRERVLHQLDGVVKRYTWSENDFERLLLDYPLRPAKGLRPSICIAAARTLGATEEAVLTSAAAIELLHNAFLIHDDVEDESLFRRGEHTLQRT